MTESEALAKIEKLEVELAELKGTECEVYSRVVGYFRPVKQWNNGKQEEFEDRKMFVLEHEEATVRAL